MNTINTNKQLQEFCHPLLSSETPLSIGVDTEFIRERTYWPKLCLIQITSSFIGPEAAVLIDPLANIDLKPFQALLSAPHITKVIHSARQDIEIFWHEWQTLPKPFFDTQVASMVCGLGEGIGYGGLVKLLFDCDLEKESQYTDWTRRPLTEKQLIYAQADVTHLLPAFKLLSQKLTELNRWEWMKDDLSILLNPQTYAVDPQQAWLRIHTHRQKPQNLAVLQDICAWREINAIQLNVNRGRLLRDECILKIGLMLPKTVDELKEIADSKSLSSDLAQELFALYQASISKPKDLWPEAPKKHVLSTITRQRLDTLREKLNEVTQTLNVPARLIAPKHDLIALAEGHLEGNRIMTGWRHDVFGHLVEQILLDTK
ncbi:MAG: ribonuclease D [Alphaproteobacteria bacterium]|jgi:ribonuclease D|nr:ribonuclease D [Alphaproteobacteria bacterium]